MNSNSTNIKNKSVQEVNDSHASDHHYTTWNTQHLTLPGYLTWKGLPFPEPRHGMRLPEQTLGPGHATAGYCQNQDIHKFFGIAIPFLTFFCTFCTQLHTAGMSTFSFRGSRD